MTDSQVEAQAENNAEGVQKLTDTKAIIAYLVEKFPLCFIAEGEAKPLKTDGFALPFMHLRTIPPDS